MASVEHLPPGEPFDSSDRYSDTPYASRSPDLSEDTHSVPTSASINPIDPVNQLGQVVDPQGNNRPRLPSLSIRSRAFSSASSTSSIRRKPLPLTISPQATRFSTGEHLAGATLEHLPELPEPNLTRAYSLDSPTLHDFPPTPRYLSSYKELSLDDSPGRQTKPVALTTQQSYDQTPSNRSEAQFHPPQSPNLSIPTPPLLRDSLLPKHAVRLTVDSAPTSASESNGTWYSDSSTTSQSHSTMSIFSSKPTPPHNLNSPNGIQRTFTNEPNDSTSTIQKPQPKSPSGSKLGSFFGWGGSTSPTASLSENSFSPLPSTPQASENLADVSRPNTKPVPTAIDVPKANADVGGYFGSSYLQIPLATPTTPLQIEEMESELKEISAELASSIRREMDLEDLVERLQAEAQNPSPLGGKRTSDYFSDAGTSSIGKYGEYDPKQDELDRAIRKTQVEKAQMRLELTDKVQVERTRRKELEKHIRSLEEKASQVDLVSINSLDTTGRLKDLESTCEDLRRRLSEERQVKDNFEDLLTALKSELEGSHNERDNLRDEIIPQLQARVEGLEAQAAQHEKLTYERTKMEQELQNLKTENANLANAQKQQADLQQKMKAFDSIAEEPSPSPVKSRSMTITRSNSVAHGAVSNRSRPPSLSRSSSVKATESRDALAERVKDIELQRDSLHSALKSLLERQEYQNRENQKKIRQLEIERDRALSNSPKRIGYGKEVASLREEINTLRRRADEAIEQKWQCEKGLSGLKMDLDRAEQEIGSLRSLLQENAILLSNGQPHSESRPNGDHVSSESLEAAYQDLQKAYAESLERVKSLETPESKDEETKRAMEQLQQSLAVVISERDFATKEADVFREHCDSFRREDKNHLGEQLALSEELLGSAQRIEELALQVRQQLATNSTLRKRLADTIERGEKEQKTNAQKIMMMQGKLKVLEDQLTAAQNSSEDKISKHEEEIKDLKISHNSQLQRVKDGLRSPRLFGPKSPLSPLFTNALRTPQLFSTSSGKALSVSEDSQMEFLKRRVMDLEKALADADHEMEEVVGRMNVAQIEVMELQNEREEAQRETRRLQRAVEEERIRAVEARLA